MSTAQNVANYALWLQQQQQNFPQKKNIELNQNFTQNGYVEVDNFAQNDYIELNQNFAQNGYAEPENFAQNEYIEQQENVQGIFHIDLDEEELYPTVDPNDVSIFANVEMEAPAVNSLKSTRRPVKRTESTPANKNKSKQAKWTSLLDSRDQLLVEVGENLRLAAQMHMDAASQQVNSMKSLELHIERLGNRNYNEILASNNAVKQLVSLKFLRTALFTRRWPHYCLL